MTALKPIENRLVVGVASGRYPLNEVCAMPECWDLADDPHHIWPRSQIGNDSWFVSVEEDGRPSPPIPHVIGLCRPHHSDVEEHRAWIRLEGEFLWFDRITPDHPMWEHRGEMEWELVGVLDPQPAKGEKSRKPVRRLQGEDRRKRKRVSIALPDDWEDGGQLWDELVEDVKDWLYAEGVFGDRGRIPVAEALFAMHHDWVQLRQHTPRDDREGRVFHS